MYNLLLLRTKYTKCCATIDFYTHYSHTNLIIDKDGIDDISKRKNPIKFDSYHSIVPLCSLAVSH